MYIKYKLKIITTLFSYNIILSINSINLNILLIKIEV